MRILVTNDDGIFAEGIYDLAKALQDIGEVIVAAPNSERSATGHAITIHHPLRVDKVRFFDTTIEAYSISGTPADCVKLAVEALLKDRRPDIVISGINNGPNLGTDVIYSGTVSAAVEAAIMDIDSIAISMGSTNITQYTDAANFVCRIAKEIIHNNDIKDTIININYPTCPKEEVKGVKVTTLGVRKYENTFIERKDPRGNSYYWTSGNVVDMEQNQDSDILALQNGYISITPIHFDLTHFKTFEKIKKLNFQK
ncbi:5'-nucleotidase /3'-nucleotidase /exopolyphosphatase [Natronincola peptidivorans]|uniref:5'-nucleotidase SurE n=1 Tax=Natronincola peptidivorans TaxID=426128 RepID=A0A1H9YJQ4_9FIRM|nr:5'/3'-nucleotidase SurE [Natronincola peptidivorans]SES69224.1 5'-nucleotidase /3'-nucleotidase /exopolyphosphatase [Natronincola peptidivorans]